MLKVLFLCTGNSCRSQTAEGRARHLRSGVLEPYSAGVEKHGLNPNAVKVMAEAGVDISGQRSKHLDELGDVESDHVITVCVNAHESCPAFPGPTRVTLLHYLTPVTICALLVTLVSLLSFKGDVILSKPLTILWIAVPLFIQTVVILALGYVLSKS